MKVLLGGIPLGCNNIGDEAIVGCVVSMLKSSLPDASITVATADPATAERLGVAVVPPYGFRDVPVEGFADVVARHDAYIWCGATGLSDYPGVALDLLESAQREGVDTYIWGVGMDDELNPVFFRAHGKRLALLRCFGLVGHYERSLREKLARRIARILPRCRGVWLRDSQSARMLASLGFAGAKVAADTAILQKGGSGNAEGSSPHGPSAPTPTLGLCISTQRQVSDIEGLRRFLATMRAENVRVVGIPMNTKTDRELLGELGVECIEGLSPEDVVDAAAKCGAVLTSRLHLLILAANAGTRGFGIARGSKLANWLSNFGLSVEGSVYDCDWDLVAEHVLAALRSRGDWDEVRRTAYEKLNARLEKARGELVEMLAK